MSRPSVVLSLVVRDEAGRYLSAMLERTLPLVDAAVVIDDASEDATPDLCEEALKRHGKGGRVMRLKTSLFHREHELRLLAWNAALELRPTWLLILDADELLEEKSLKVLPLLLKLDTADAVTFRFFDMWDERCYRDDDLWTIHRRDIPRLTRVEDQAPAERWFQKDQHCGAWPPGFIESRRRWLRSGLRIQHLGWSREPDRKAKYERYMRLDPEGKHGSLPQYRSILDPHPNLVEWKR